jgi:Tfp pilus assembly protein PilX
MKAKQQGVTMLVVLVLLSVMLLGGLAFARLTEVGTLARGNTAFREASLQAAEVGVNTAYAAVKDPATLPDENANTGTWYFATRQPLDARGIPMVDFNLAPEVIVGPNRIRYVVERVCDVAAVTDSLRECLVRQEPQMESARAGAELLDPPNARQFRVTVRVTGPKDTVSWVQLLVTKG